MLREQDLEQGNINWFLHLFAWELKLGATVDCLPNRISIGKFESTLSWQQYFAMTLRAPRLIYPRCRWTSAVWTLGQCLRHRPSIEKRVVSVDLLGDRSIVILQPAWIATRRFIAGYKTPPYSPITVKLPCSQLNPRVLNAAEVLAQDSH